MDTLIPMPIFYNVALNDITAGADANVREIPNDAIVALTIAGRGMPCVPAGIVLNMRSLQPVQREVIRVLNAARGPCESNAERALASLCLCSMIGYTVPAARLETLLAPEHDEDEDPFVLHDRLGNPESYEQYVFRTLCQKDPFSDTDLPSNEFEDDAQALAATCNREILTMHNVEFIFEVLGSLADRCGGKDRFWEKPGLVQHLRQTMDQVDTSVLSDPQYYNLRELARTIRDLPLIAGFERALDPYDVEGGCQHNLLLSRAKIIADWNNRVTVELVLGVRTTDMVDRAFDVFERRTPDSTGLSDDAKMVLWDLYMLRGMNLAPQDESESDDNDADEDAESPQQEEPESDAEADLSEDRDAEPARKKAKLSHPTEPEQPLFQQPEDPYENVRRKLGGKYDSLFFVHLEGIVY